MIGRGIEAEEIGSAVFVVIAEVGRSWRVDFWSGRLGSWLRGGDVGKFCGSADYERGGAEGDEPEFWLAKENHTIFCPA